MNNKKELAHFLGMIHSIYNKKLSADHFYGLLIDYEKNHEGQTSLKGQE